ncbi:hypothetical protein QYF36_025000 [Acer negundo]|nr:hypothetical protein QYF36_025000 [Acer negundo]
MQQLFSKLNTTDLEKKLIVPTRAVERFSIPEGKEFVDLVVKDLKEEIWNFRLTIHPMPALTEGWIEFVRAKDLVPDDIVTFYKLRDEIFGDEYRVETDSEYKWTSASGSEERVGRQNRRPELVPKIN